MVPLASQETLNIDDWENISTKKVISAPPKQPILCNAIQKLFAKWCLVLIPILCVISVCILLLFLAHDSANDIRTSTYHKTISTLANSPTYGRTIHAKSTPGCLEHEKTIQGNSLYFIDAKTCNPFDKTVRQQWSVDRMTGDLFHWETFLSSKIVNCSGGDNQILGTLLSGVQICLRKSASKFTITTFVNFKEKAVFFTINSKDRPNLCLTLCSHCASTNITPVLLERCTGSEEQLFSLAEVNYEMEFAELDLSFLVRLFNL